MSLMKPQAILLDLDNTLYPYQLAHEPALEAAQKKAKQLFMIEEDLFYSLYNRAKQEVKEQVTKQQAACHSRLLYFHSLLELYGMKSQPLLALDLEQTYWQCFLNNMQIPKEVFEFFTEIKLLNIGVCIVTDLTTQIQFRKLAYHKLDDYIDYIVTSEEVGQEKPHPAIFKRALTKLNMSVSNPIDKVWMIGDTLEKDLAGAKQAVNAVTIHMNAYSEKENFVFQPDITVKSFNGLIKLITEAASCN